MKLVIIRHGESEHNIEERYNSNPCHEHYFISNLTQKGRKEALEAAAQLGELDKETTLVWHSPLPRTTQTATIVHDALGLSLPIAMQEELTEVKAGDREGQLTQNYTEHSWDCRPLKKVGGESEEDVDVRLSRLIPKFPQDCSLILVTHGTPAKVLIKKLSGLSVRLKTAQVISFPLSEISERIEKSNEIIEKAKNYPASEYLSDDGGPLYSLEDYFRYKSS